MTEATAASRPPRRQLRIGDSLSLLLVLPFVFVMALGITTWHTESMVRSVSALLMMYLVIVGASRWHAHLQAQGAWERRELLSVGQAAECLGVTGTVINEWLSQGRLLGMNYGGRTGWRVSRDDVERERAR